MVIIKKSANDKCWRGCGEKGAILQHWWGCNLVQPLYMNSMEVPLKAKNTGTILSNNPLLDLYPEKTIQ